MTLRTANDFHNATDRLCREARIVLHRLTEQYAVDMSTTVRKPTLDVVEGYGDYGWVTLFDRKDRTEVPLVLCFGFAVKVATREVGHMTMRREPEPHRIFITTDDLFNFEGLFEAVAEELAVVL